jgi:hypothetical protein
MLILPPAIVVGPGGHRYQATFRRAAGARDEVLWFEVPAAFADLLSRRVDAALLGLLLPAMAAGENIEVAGSVSAQLLAYLRGDAQDLLRRVLPALHPIRIEASRVTDEPESRAGHCLAGFSGGVDSFFTLFAPAPSGQPAVTHLAHYNVGSHGRGQRAAGIFAQRAGRAAAIADRLGLPLVTLDSNLDDLMGRGLGFMATHVLRTAAATAALQGGVTAYLFAGAYHRDRQGRSPAGDISRYEDEMLPRLAPAGMTFAVTGSDFTRVQKTLLIAAHPLAREHLDVCLEPRRARGRANCSACLKCLRALMVLEIAGRLAQFATAFDLRRYRRLRWFAFAQLLSGTPDSRSEILGLAAERGFRLPAGSGFWSLPLPFWFARRGKTLLSAFP